LNENPPRAIFNRIQQQFIDIAENAVIKQFADENIKNICHQLKIKFKLYENNNASSEPKNTPEFPRHQSNLDLNYQNVLKNIKELLSSTDWAKTKRIAFFASKPTTVRKMLSIIKNTEVKGAEMTISALQNFLNKRADHRWLTNKNAKIFYPKFKAILNDLENKQNELATLQVFTSR
jgi:hypothetical protein